MLGDNIKMLRERHEMPQSKLAEYCGVTQQAVGLWEKNKTTPDYDTLIKIATLFNVSIDCLLGQEKPPAYYTDPETARLAEDLKNNPGGRVLFDAGKGLKPESIEEVLKFINYQKAKEGQQ